MPPAENLEQILILARKYNVSRLKFDQNSVSELDFFPAIATITQKPIDAAASLGIRDMPSDEEFRYYHSPIVPAPAPVPQEEQRKVS